MLGFVAVMFLVVAWLTDRDNKAKHAAEAAELTRECLAARYTSEQCEFIVALSMRGISGGPDEATMAAIQAAIH